MIQQSALRVLEEHKHKYPVLAPQVDSITLLFKEK